MNAEKTRSDERRVVVNRPFRGDKTKRAQEVTDGDRRVRCKVYATEAASLGEGPVGAGGGGGTSGQEKRAVMNLAHILAVSSWP